MLTERLPDSLKLTRATFGMVALLSAVLLVLSYQPLYYTDLWGHLSYGKLIFETQALPDSEPFMPLAKGMPLVDSAWLSQLSLYALEARFGLTALQFLHAALCTACFSLLAWRFCRTTRHVPAAVLGLAVFGGLNWFQLLVVRPQMAGMACFVGLLALLTSRSQSRARWVAMPLLLALWANLHGSFVVGLAMLGCWCAGRAIDVWRRTGRLAAIRHDRLVRRLFLTTELAAAAVLLNPYGLRLYSHVLSFSANPNLADLVEWHPLQIRDVQGQAAALVALGLVFAYRLSPRRVSAIEVLSLLLFGGAALWTQRMLAWFAPVAAGCLVWNGLAAWQKLRGTGAAPADSPRTGRWSLAVVALLWVVAASTPFGFTLLHGPKIEFRSISPDTPIAAAEYLKKNPPRGLIFNTYEWGDYLLWAGPPGLQVFITSQAHLAPPDVWRHYMSVINGGGKWDETLDNYGVNTIVVDRQERAGFISRLKKDEAWKLAFEDSLASIFVRKRGI